MAEKLFNTREEMFRALRACVEWAWSDEFWEEFREFVEDERLLKLPEDCVRYDIPDDPETWYSYPQDIMHRELMQFLIELESAE